VRQNVLSFSKKFLPETSLKNEAICSPKTPVKFYQITKRHFLTVNILQTLSSIDMTCTYFERSYFLNKSTNAERCCELLRMCSEFKKKRALQVFRNKLRGEIFGTNNSEK
jgi:hypothetical protein